MLKKVGVNISTFFNIQMLRLKIKIFNREICVGALPATNSFMRRKQRRNGEKHGNKYRRLRDIRLLKQADRS